MYKLLKRDFDNLKNKFETITTRVEYYNLKEYLKLLKDLKSDIDYEIGCVRSHQTVMEAHRIFIKYGKEKKEAGK